MNINYINVIDQSYYHSRSGQQAEYLGTECLQTCQSGPHSPKGRAAVGLHRLEKVIECLQEIQIKKGPQGKEGGNPSG